ncbi:MAG TPA: hypothetical protein VN228_12370 [Pyrinomonadaceae bacterium]|nr:hypothetical protein [Pyrinomonadaceae bacterium]
MNGATNFLRRALTVAAVAALVCAPHARASVTSRKTLETARDLSAAVEAGSRVTYLDLVRLVFPGAEGGEPARATRSIPLSHADGDYADKTFEGAMSVDYVERVFIRGGGERLAALLIHVSPAPAESTPPAGGGDLNGSFNWGGIAVLAVYRLTPAPRLLGALDVRGDRETSLWEAHPVTPLGARDSGVWFVNAHHNAGEEYRAYGLAAYVAGRLKPVLARAPMLHGWRGCRRAVTPRAAVETSARRGSARRDLTFVVGETVERFAEDCRSRVGRLRRRTSRNLFRWDARRGLYEARGAG